MKKYFVIEVDEDQANDFIDVVNLTSSKWKEVSIFEGKELENVEVVI